MPSDLIRFFQLDPDYTFLNHGSFGACPRPVFDQYQQWQRELEARPVEFLNRRFPQLMAESRSALAAFLGTEANNLVYVPNATTGINIVAQTLDLEPGDEILSTDLEYGALDRAWEKVERLTGAKYIRRHIDLPISTAEHFIEQVWSGRTDRTKVLFLSHITSSTAITFPVEALIARARAEGIITVIDGAHCPGQINLHLDKLGADFYTGNCHKWMMTPKGSAFLYGRAESQHLIGPLVVSWGDKSAPDSPFVQELEFVGTYDISAYLSIPAAIRFMNENDWDAVRIRCHELVRHYRSRMIELVGTEPLVPDDPKWYSQMCAHPLPPLDGDELKRRLYDDYRIEVPVTEVRGRWYLRASAQGYNDTADMDRLLDAVAALLPELTHARAT